MIGDRPGHGADPRGVVLVTAHLDSVNIAGPAAAAPGADDNGSGSAGAIAIARALANHRSAHDLRIILFSGEEQGLFGSLHYVASLSADERQRIRAVVNMDMVAGKNTTDPTVLLEGGSGVSEAVIDRLAAAAATYTSLRVQTSLDPFNSDHVPFIDAGIPAVLTIEGADQANTRVHTELDRVDRLDFDVMAEILAMNLAFIAETLGKEGDSAMPEVPVGRRTLTLDGGNLTEVLRNLPFQLSGRYEYNGGASQRQGRSFVDTGTGTSTAALRDARYALREPVYLAGAARRESSARAAEPRFTLHVDVDGTDPIGVVSGTVAIGDPVPTAEYPHFIGRVASDVPAGSGRLLTISDFTFQWPHGTEIIERISVEIAGAALSIPSAKVTFHVRGPEDHVYGPYVAQQASIFFRDVEMDVDLEANAVACEPLDTHVHPDRPSDLPQETLTFESAFAKAGIRITRAAGSGTVVTAGAGTDKRWSYSELHDSMELHWEAFANKPQWKMWIFLAELAESDSLGGVMFDGEIDEPGGMDRQGTAIFTRCPYFHTLQGEYVQANPPGTEAIKRELFFNLMHETGHAFNLAHSFQKELGTGWQPPPWMPLRNDPQALSWMNYPDAATPGGGAGANASWFYRRFHFRFDAAELLFLRHAPETYVEMGGEAWFENHGRVPGITLDPRLELQLRSRRTLALYGGRTATEVELGEPVMLELRLRNAGPHPLMVHANLDPSDGLVELAVTNAKGERRPFLPIDHTRTTVLPRLLEPDGRLYQLIDLTIGSFGFPFKEPGAYRVEASYRNLDGSTAAAVLQVYVRPARTPDVVPVLNELYDARVGRAIYVDGTRVMGDVNDRIDWVRARLDTLMGESNPTSLHLRTVRYQPLARTCKLVDPHSKRLRELPGEPDVVARELKRVVVDQCQAAADTMGHILFTEVVETYARAAGEANQSAAGRAALQSTARMFETRGVVPSVVASLRQQDSSLEGTRTRPTPVRRPSTRGRTPAPGSAAKKKRRKK